MASILRPLIGNPTRYRGLDWIFEYTNEDGRIPTYNCGQAAAATFLTHHGRMDPVQAARNIAWLERHHGPDQFGGWLGTGRKRMERIIRSFDIDLTEVRGIAGIRAELDRNNPVLVMLGTTLTTFLGFNIPGGHWMVAYGYEGNSVHMTNGWLMTWAEIEASWDSITAKWIRMNGCGLAKPVHS